LVVLGQAEVKHLGVLGSALAELTGVVVVWFKEGSLKSR
jgi:hypothetical protein